MSQRPANDNGESAKARAVLARDCQQKPTEQQPLPLALQQSNPETKSAAQWVHERIILYIKNFEEQLDENHEVGMGFVSGGGGMLRIEGVGFFAPDLVAFYGTDTSGNKANLVQHFSQLNLMLRALPKRNEKPQRIGFELQNALEAEVASEATSDADSNTQA